MDPPLQRAPHPLQAARVSVHRIRSPRSIAGERGSERIRSAGSLRRVRPVTAKRYPVFAAGYK